METGGMMEKAENSVATIAAEIQNLAPAIAKLTLIPAALDAVTPAARRGAGE